MAERETQVSGAGLKFDWRELIFSKGFLAAWVNKVELGPVPDSNKVSAGMKTAALQCVSVG